MSKLKVEVGLTLEVQERNFVKIYFTADDIYTDSDQSVDDQADEAVESKY